jgi:hypothetical protein
VIKTCVLKTCVHEGVCGSTVPEEEEFRMELHTLIARELTGTGNTERVKQGRGGG